LWDWENGWVCVHEFEDAHSGSVTQVAFDPKNDNKFASVSEDGTVKVWSSNKTDIDHQETFVARLRLSDY
jgi:WD40 repeat protein